MKGDPICLWTGDLSAFKDTDYDRGSDLSVDQIPICLKRHIMKWDLIYQQTRDPSSLKDR